jgi:hypothetical protein
VTFGARLTPVALARCPGRSSPPALSRPKTTSSATASTRATCGMARPLRQRRGSWAPTPHGQAMGRSSPPATLTGIHGLCSRSRHGVLAEPDRRLAASASYRARRRQLTGYAKARFTSHSPPGVGGADLRAPQVQGLWRRAGDLWSPAHPFSGVAPLEWWRCH